MEHKMSFMAAKLLSRHGSKPLRKTWHGVLKRMTSTDSPCPPPPAPEPFPSCPPPKECCPPPPPCPPIPADPPTLCPQNPDPNNPCNYCPPPCIDPDYPEITRLKRLQCKFQEDNGLPIYLKGGKMDVVLYHSTIIMVVISLLISAYAIKEMQK